MFHVNVQGNNDDV